MSPCPICRHPAPPRAQNKSFPFCSPRCKLVDLGKWLDEQYRVPVSELDDGMSPAPPEHGRTTEDELPSVETHPNQDKA
jgi:endogenous inhibitor of DNA gyrase (YacG/DUF329 family)